MTWRRRSSSGPAKTTASSSSSAPPFGANLRGHPSGPPIGLRDSRPRPQPHASHKNKITFVVPLPRVALRKPRRGKGASGDLKQGRWGWEEGIWTDTAAAAWSIPPSQPHTKIPPTPPPPPPVHPSEHTQGCPAHPTARPGAGHSQARGRPTPSTQRAGEHPLPPSPPLLCSWGFPDSPSPLTSPLH